MVLSFNHDSASDQEHIKCSKLVWWRIKEYTQDAGCVIVYLKLIFEFYVSNSLLVQRANILSKFFEKNNYAPFAVQVSDCLLEKANRLYEKSLQL